MCTLTWLFESDGYRLHFNRDERKTRVPARAPERRLAPTGGAAYLAPQDGEGGGTWLSVNGHGLSLALLNAYQHVRDPLGEPSEAAGVLRSRGLLVADLALACGVSEVGERMVGESLRRYAPFSLYAFEPAASRAALPTGLAFEWDGAGLQVSVLAGDEAPVSSSAFDTRGAAQARRALFAELDGARLSAADLDRFHASHAPARGALSPCMHRDDAHTVSYSRIVVTPAQVRFDYRPEAPCLGRPFVSVALARESAPSLTRG